ncbi:Zinc ABC transporter, ATP-binding protein ZnuC [Rhodovastum atsumiense]|uniref:Metal ABC transporter ATP-binding protein n=1 Tax=Rhodovastum atsumiense TaxID=504468 RepID=A0A5M6IR79_9PROT|nr:metal ABC transporter ATP-binding protein [Rhodovastum atsumiense]KAA5610786.1 metal ABC transporter ATP-binding protein [Rhodovastum atsumiense]CAH2604456.1 Zinc ABC transporter, ATP-binding protein ZnuC [Rhodovastum atsumiense]
MTIPSAIVLEDVTCVHERRPAVHHLSGRFAPGSLTAVAGPNGAGKTTLLRALAGLHPVDQGRIDRGGLAAGQIALLPQAGTLDRSFPVTCHDVVALGAWTRIGPFRRLPSDIADRVATALREVGLAGFERRLVGSLSAGQFQRMLFARLALQDAPVLLLDEPLNAVDARTAADLMAMLRRWHGEGRTIIAVLHDLDLVTREFPETLLLAREQVAWGPTAQVLTAEHRLRARLAAEAWAGSPELCRDAA